MRCVCVCARMDLLVTPTRASIEVRWTNANRIILMETNSVEVNTIDVLFTFGGYKKVFFLLNEKKQLEQNKSFT